MIVAAAILHEGKIYTLPPPARHHHVLAANGERELPDGRIVWRLRAGTQGFVDDTGRFLDRIDAARHALACGQISELSWPPRLYSEDLW